MRKSMEKWLHKFQIPFSADTANSVCNSLGLDGEKMDECIGLCYQFEKGDIDNGEFTGGLCVLTGKEPEEVVGILKGVKGTRSKMTLDELDRKAIALFIKRHGREAYESGEIGETLERIEQLAEEYDPVFLSRHPDLKGKSITVYHDPLAGEDWAVVNSETGEVVEVFNEELLIDEPKKD